MNGKVLICTFLSFSLSLFTSMLSICEEAKKCSHLPRGSFGLIATMIKVFVSDWAE